MNKKTKDWFIILSVLFFASLLHQIEASLMPWLLGAGKFSLGPISLGLHKSHVMGDIAQHKNLIYSSFLGVFFLSLFLVLNLILTQRLLGLRVALALFTASMLGDSIDTVFRGVSMQWFSLFQLKFNLNTILLLSGLFLTVFFTIKDRNILFNKNSLRKSLFVEKDQYLFCFYMLFPYLLFSSGFYMFFHIFIQGLFNSLPHVPENIRTQALNSFLLIFSSLSLCFFLLLVIFVFYYSNKIYGPIYAFKKYIKEVFLKGSAPARDFKLRSGDQFKDLPGLISQMKAKFHKKP